MRELIIWSKEEINTVAKEFSRRFSPIRPTMGYIDKAQQVLPSDRRKRFVTGALLTEFRARVKEIDEAVSNNEETTLPAKEESFPPIFSTEAPHSVEPPSVKASRSTLPVSSFKILKEEINGTNGHIVEKNGFHKPSDISSSHQIIDALAEINRQVILLKSLSSAELHAATRYELDSRRIINMVTQAVDGLVFFEEIIHVAERH